MFVITCIVTSMARNSLLCADVPLRNYSLTHSLSSKSFLRYGGAVNFPFPTAGLPATPDIHIHAANRLDLVRHTHIGNKLQSISPTIGVYQHVRSLSRRDVVIIHRLRISHTRLTHGYLLSGTDQPECSACHCPLTVKHILIESPH